MQVLKILYNIDYRGLNKINQEIEYIKDNKVLNRKKSYETFKLLLSKNKKIKNKKEKLTYKEIEDISGISKRTYYYINKEVKQKGLTYWKILEIDNNKENRNKNRRPKNFRKSKILNNKEIIDKILKIRLDNPTYGKSKIKAILDREYKNINNIDNNNSNNIDNNIYNNINNNIPNNISESTIGRILKELSNKSLITLKGSKLNKKLKPNEINNTKPRNFNNSYSKRWNYKNNSITIKEKDNKNNNISNKNNIGTMIQIDHLKYHNSKINLRFVEFSAIEAQSRKMMCLHNHFNLLVCEVRTERSEGHPTTRIKQSYCYATPSSKNAKDFLINHLIPTLPFNIKSIQVDGGFEFRKYFEEACKELNIPLFVLPPYSPKYNGRIERSNRTIREEFYNNKKLLENCITRADYNDKLKEYIDKYNNYRPHQALDFKTPM